MNWENFDLEPLGLEYLERQPHFPVPGTIK